ncbi:uncharacterized protein [Rutidosis leptorrhynchoides]|uniref:uncharacterized protein n=1 Tax=Rutidosis leptorrhynchoides TaxID=125765 RepID=UPI003A9A2B83
MATHMLGHPYLVLPSNLTRIKSVGRCKLSIKNRLFDQTEAHKLVLEVKEKLERKHRSLPIGRNGRDDEDIILWFLKDGKFSVDRALGKLTKAIKWREEFRVNELSEASVSDMTRTGKAYVHDFLAVNGQPVFIVIASKHLPGVHDSRESEKLSVFLIEKALSKLPPGKEEILGIIDLRGFGSRNVDFKFLAFLVDVFYYYYPDRLGLILFVEAPFIFQPFWQLAQPLFKPLISLVRFCDVETLRKEYFTEATLPDIFRN